MKVTFWLSVLFVFSTLSAPFRAEGEGPKIPVLTIQDTIVNPVSSEYIADAIDEAEGNGAPALIIELDTPGGLLSSTRVIVKKIMNARVPVIVYVAPSGSRAGSAGVFVTLAAHVAAMAPSTNIGAAHPVEFGENPKKGQESLREFFESFKKEPSKKEHQPRRGVEGEARSGSAGRGGDASPYEDPMEDKILNDTVAWVSTIAKTRNRSVEWAIRAVRESVSTGEDEAVKLGVVDFVAKDLPDLLTKAEGRRVRLGDDQEATLHLTGIPIERKGMTIRQQILNVLINPNIAYILMILGFYGLLFEITHPGAWFPGVAGLICLILAFYAFHTLPTNYAGLSLIGLAIILFIAEVKVTSYGLLTLAGVVCMLLGSLFLVNSTAEFMQISLKLIVPVVVSTAAIFFFLVSLAVRAQRQKSAVGLEAMCGRIGEVTQSLPEGKVTIDGEIWNAVSEGPIEKGERVRVVSVTGMTLKVEIKKRG